MQNARSARNVFAIVLTGGRGERPLPLTAGGWLTAPRPRLVVSNGAIGDAQRGDLNISESSLVPQT
jgi:hypothetical protein